MDEFSFRYDFNAISDMEDAYGRPIGDVFRDERLTFSAMRLLVWGGQKGRISGYTKAQAGQDIQAYVEGGGNIGALAEKILKAVRDSGFFVNFTEAES